MAVSSAVVLDAGKEAEAQTLARRIGELAEEEFLQIARLLVGKSTGDLFGETELQVRDILHRAGAKAFEEYLRQKKTVTKEAVSSVRPANKRPSFRVIVPSPP